MSVVDGAKRFIADRMYEAMAVKDVLNADRDGDGSLNLQEYQAVSLYKGDDLLSSHQRGFEFAVIDELKQADGQISIGELAKFYQKLDANSDGKVSLQEYDAVLAKSSLLTKLRFPLAAAASTVGYWGDRLEAWVTTPRD